MNFKNWKSTSAFFIFISIYIYSMYADKDAGIVEVAGYIALYSSLFLMFRSDFTAGMIEKIIDNLKISR